MISETQHILRRIRQAVHISRHAVDTLHQQQQEALPTTAFVQYPYEHTCNGVSSTAVALPAAVQAAVDTPLLLLLRRLFVLQPTVSFALPQKTHRFDHFSHWRSALWIFRTVPQHRSPRTQGKENGTKQLLVTLHGASESHRTCTTMCCGGRW